MKRLLTIVPLVPITFILYSQVPQRFNYQAVARDAIGNLLVNQPVTIRLSVLDGSSSGAAQYSELHAVMTNEYGLFILTVGSGTVLSGTFSAITWGSDKKFLKVEMDPAGGTNYFPMGTIELVSVPYSLWSEKAQTAESVSSLALNDLADVVAGNPISGQVLKWNGTEWAPAADNTGSGADNWGTQVVSTDATLSGDGTAGNPLSLSQQGAITGQVLKWNGTSWMPANETGTTYSSGSGISISGTTINNSGDTDATNDITNTTAAGGDLNGIYPNPTVDGLQGKPVAANAPATGQVLKFDGAQWAPAADEGVNYTAGNGINISGTVISNSIDALTEMNDVNTNGALSGDVLKFNGAQWVPATDNTSSSSGGVNVSPRLSGDGTAGTPLDIAQQGASSGQVLKWNGSAWAPDNDNGASYSAGAGISIVSAIISNSGDTNASDDVTIFTSAGGDVSGMFSNLQIAGSAVTTNEIADGSIQSQDMAAGVIPSSLPPSGVAGGDLSGAYPNPTVSKIQGNAVSAIIPASGQVLKWNGTSWAPAADDGISGTGAAGYLPKWSGTSALGNSQIFETGVNVGIGTTSPQGKLHVSGNDDTTQLIIEAGSAQTNAHPLIELRSSTGADLLSIHSDGPANTFVGLAAGRNNTYVNDTMGNANTFIGSLAGYSNMTGHFNVAVGREALYSNPDADENTAVGGRALYSNSTGDANTALGRSALYSNTSGNSNTAFGVRALYSNTGGDANTASGRSALFNNTGGSNNTAYGRSTLFSNTTGNANTAFGVRALYNNTTGSYLVAVGDSALISNGVGATLSSQATANTAVGSKALFSNTTGTSKTALGRNALYNVTTGSGNTAVGYLAGDSYANANNNTFIGYNADATVPGLTNSAAIGFNAAVSSSNNFVFGNSSVAGWGFGTAPGSEAIKVGTGPANGNGAHLTLGGVWTDASARSKKEDFTEMNSEETLSKIAQLPVTRWKYSGTENEYHIGPMADDFFRMFQVGDDQSISAMDKTGVLFLGVQALTIENKKQDDLLKQQLEIIKRQNERIERLECLVEELRRKL